MMEGVSVGFVGFRRQQKLNAKITQEIGLIASGRFKAASGHEEKDYPRTDFIASAKVDGGRILRETERTLVIKLHVAFQS